MSRPRGALAAAVLAAAASTTAPAFAPGGSLGAAGAGVPGVAVARAGEAGTIEVNLVDSVGEAWFRDIGDREVALRLIEGVEVKDLPSLDVPALLREGHELTEVARTVTDGGKARMPGIEQGVYLLEVMDNPDTADARVSYAPVVVVLAPDAMTRAVSPKAQVVDVGISSHAPCTTTEWLGATAPGRGVGYDVRLAIPNPNASGEGVGVYEVTVEFGRGHTAARALKVELVSGDQRTALEHEVKTDGATVTITLSEAARRQLARARVNDPSTHVELRVPASVENRGPWGSVKRGDVLGTLDVVVTLRTDGMDARRTPVTVSQENHVSVVSHANCFTRSGPGGGAGSGSGAGGSGAGSGSGGGAGTGSAPGSGAGTGSEAGPGAGPGSESTGGGSAEEQGARPGSGSESPRERFGLATTGASIIGITLLALALIALGLVLRRKGRSEADR